MPSIDLFLMCRRVFVAVQTQGVGTTQIMKILLRGQAQRGGPVCVHTPQVAPTSDTVGCRFFLLKIARFDAKFMTGGTIGKSPRRVFLLTHTLSTIFFRDTFMSIMSVHLSILIKIFLTTCD